MAPDSLGLFVCSMVLLLSGCLGMEMVSSTEDYKTPSRSIVDISMDFNTTFRTSQGTFVDSSPGVSLHELVSCVRIRVPGRSRFLNMHKFAHIAHVRLESAAFSTRKSFPNMQVAVHLNSSFELCQSSKDKWKPMEKGVISLTLSPFGTKYIDARTTDSLTDTEVTVSAKEEFHSFRVAFLGIGFLILLVSGQLSKWVPFYYSSAMTLGILAVVIILLYQGMKLLPTGRKSSLYILLYGSAVGIGSVIVHYITSAVSSALVQLGLGDDMLNPIVVFILMGIVILGAWLGYWGVRKLVLSDDGTVDVGTSQFVKWSLRLVGLTVLLQSSYDGICAVLLTASASILCWLLGKINLRELAFWISDLERPSLNVFHGLSYSKRGKQLDHKNHARIEAYRKLWFGSSPLRSSGPLKSSSPLKSPFMRSPVVSPTSPPSSERTKHEDYYSTFHRTPGRKQMSKAEWEELTRSCTQDAMKDLLASPDFASWAVSQADRILVTPHEQREERPEDEIERTADMDIEHSENNRRRIYR